MRSSIKYIAAAIIACSAGNIAAQELRTGYFTDSYLYRHDLNPAFGNEHGYISIPIVGNVNLDMMGNFGYEELVRKNPLYPNRSDKKMTSFMNPYLTNPLKGSISRTPPQKEGR